MMADLCEELLDGKTFREVSVKHGVSTERVRQVVRKTLRMNLHPSRKVEEYPDHNAFLLKDFRAQRHFWRRQLARFRNEQPNVNYTD